jgi:hypothetical protein
VQQRRGIGRKGMKYPTSYCTCVYLLIAASNGVAK